MNGLNYQFLWFLSFARVLLEYVPQFKDAIPTLSHQYPAVEKIHRLGLYFSWGYFLLFAPQVLL